MRSLRMAVLLAVIALVPATLQAAPFSFNFENGTDYTDVSIPGITFVDEFGFSLLYGDSRTGAYNTYSDDLGYGVGDFHHNGNFFAYSFGNAVTMSFADAVTNFTTGYSSFTTFFMDAYLTNGTVLNISGAGNTGSPMGYLTANALPGTFIDHIVLHDTGGSWIVDDMSGESVTSVPEPATSLLVGIGLLGLAAVRRRLA